MACRMIAWFLNDELKRVWKESVVVKFKVLSRRLAGGNEGTHDLRNKKKNANISTTMFYTIVHKFCSVVTAPSALRYLQMPSFRVYKL